MRGAYGSSLIFSHMKQYEIRVSKTTTRIECALLQVHGEMQWKVFSGFVTAVCTTLLLSEHNLRCMIDMTKLYHLLVLDIHMARTCTRDFIRS
jgi:predicted transcriptional regulator